MRKSWAVVIAVTAFGCVRANDAPHAGGEQRLHLTSSGNEIMGPYVPAGTAFSVELWEPLAGDPAVAGTTLLLNLRDALDAPDGTNVVPLGAFIHARVVSANAPPKANVVIDLTTVRTLKGDVPIAARLARGPTSPDATVYDFTLAAPPGEPLMLGRGAHLELVLTEPLVPAGSTYR